MIYTRGPLYCESKGQKAGLFKAERGWVLASPCTKSMALRQLARSLGERLAPGTYPLVPTSRRITLPPKRCIASEALTEIPPVSHSILKSTTQRPFFVGVALSRRA